MYADFHDRKEGVPHAGVAGEHRVSAQVLSNRNWRAGEECQRLIEHANASMFGLDSAGNVVQWNQAVARTIGYLDLAKLEPGWGMDIPWQPVKVVDLVHETVAVMEKLGRGLKIKVDAAAIRVVEADPVRVAQVLKNLLSNTIEYSEEGSPIVVRVWLSEGGVQVGVPDRGIGMTPEQQEHLCERFHRADGSDTSVSGTRLGLAVSKLIVDRHGGDIRVESRFREGTTVTFSLPLRASE